MALPNIFQTTQPSAIASYDYFEFANAIGYKKFYLSAETDSGGVGYFMTNQTPYSNPSYINYTNSSMAMTKVGDYDFDIQFNRPQIINGDVYVQYTGETNTDDVTHYAQMYLVVNIYHVDLTATETLLATMTSATRGQAQSFATTFDYRELMKSTISKKKVKIGEKIRVNIEHYHATTGGTTQYSRFYIDPASFASSTTTAYPTDFNVTLGFVIDL